MKKTVLTFTILAALFAAPVFADADSGANGEVGAAPSASSQGGFGSGFSTGSDGW